MVTRYREARENNRPRDESSRWFLVGWTSLRSLPIHEVQKTSAIPRRETQTNVSKRGFQCNVGSLSDSRLKIHEKRWRGIHGGSETRAKLDERARRLPRVFPLAAVRRDRTANWKERRDDERVELQRAVQARPKAVRARFQAGELGFQRLTTGFLQRGGRETGTGENSANTAPAGDFSVDEPANYALVSGSSRLFQLAFVGKWVIDAPPLKTTKRRHRQLVSLACNRFLRDLVHQSLFSKRLRNPFSLLSFRNSRSFQTFTCFEREKFTRANIRKMGTRELSILQCLLQFESKGTCIHFTCIYGNINLQNSPNRRKSISNLFNFTF